MTQRTFIVSCVAVCLGCGGARWAPVTPVTTSYGYGGETSAGASAWNGYVVGAPTPLGAASTVPSEARIIPLVLHHRGERVEAPLHVPFGDLHRVGVGYRLRWLPPASNRRPRLR